MYEFIPTREIFFSNDARGEKKVYPRQWDISAAGHVQKGEDSIAAATRKTLEELGISLISNRLVFSGIEKISDFLTTVG